MKQRTKELLASDVGAWIMRTLIFATLLLIAFAAKAYLSINFESHAGAEVARMEMTEKFEERIEIQNIAFQDRIETHVEDANVHMTYVDKIKEFIPRSEYESDLIHLESADADTTQEIREGFRAQRMETQGVRDHVDDRFDQLVDMIQDSR